MPVLQDPITWIAITFAVIIAVASWRYAQQQASRKSVSPAVNPGPPTPLCEHLSPLKVAMLAEGIQFSSHDPVRAICRINEPEFSKRFPPPLVYREMYQPERHQFDNPRAEIFCIACGLFYGIRVLHPDEYVGHEASVFVFPNR
jgi:hypothetical protein